MRSKTLFALPLALLATALAGGAGKPQTAPLSLAQETHVYGCQGGQTVQVTYLRTGLRTDGVRSGSSVSGPSFAVLGYQGQSYGLAEAVSGSGARYVGHAGLNTASGLEWWEHQGEATLSRFTGDDARSSTALLKCKLVR